MNKQEYIVIEIWKSAEGQLLNIYTPSAVLEFVKILELNQTSDEVYIDTYGNTWMVRDTSSGIRFAPDEIKVVKDVFGDKYGIGEFPLSISRIEDEFAELNHSIMFLHMIDRYYRQEISWDDLTPFKRNFNGVSQESTDACRDNFKATYGVTARELDLFRERMKSEFRALTGTPFDQFFSVGPVILYPTEITVDDSVVEKSRYTVMLTFDQVIRATDDKIELHCRITYILEEFFDVIGGATELYQTMKDLPYGIQFKVDNDYVTAWYKEHINPDGSVQTFVEFTSKLLDKPLKVHI